MIIGVKSKGLCRLPRYFVAFWKSEVHRPRRDREERERARDPVAIVAKIGKDLP